MPSTNKLIRFGRNPKDYNCAANQYLREIVERRVHVYRDMSRTGRSFLLKAILAHLYNQGFVFVRRDKNEGPWQSVTEREARLKVGHMFRDTMERMKKHGDDIIQYQAVGDDDEVMPLFEQEEANVQNASSPNTQIASSPNEQNTSSPNVENELVPKPALLIDLTADHSIPDAICSTSEAVGKSLYGVMGVVTPLSSTSIRAFDRSDIVQHLLRVPIIAEDEMEPIPWGPPSSACIHNQVSGDLEE